MATKEQIEKANEIAKAAAMPKVMPAESKAETIAVVMDMRFTPIYHPYQRRWVPNVEDGAVDIPLDNWLQSQIDAGLVKVVK